MRRVPSSKAFFFAFAAMAFLCAAFALFYIFSGVSAETWDYNIPRRLKVVCAIAVVGASVGISSVIFQTITANYILTPSIMGFDNLYLLLQTLVIYFWGGGQLSMMDSPADFMLTLLLMICASTAVFFIMFKGRGESVYHTVLVGVVLGMAFGGLSTFMQVFIDPSEFAVLEGRMFASFNRINVQLLGISAAVVCAAGAWFLSDLRTYDAVALGRERSISLGVNYRAVVLKSMVVVAVLTSASTVLVGPLTFLGILVVSLARALFPTYRHGILVPGAVLAAVCALLFGMIVTERALYFAVPMSVIIDFAGGLFFLLLLGRVKNL